MAKTAADQVAEMMIDAGIQRVYGVVGDSINPIVDAIRRTDGKLRWVHCRNEEVGAFAAGADALLTGQIAACAGSCGPGNLHLIQGLYNSHRNRAPVFAIAGQVPTRFLGTEYFQETHPERIFRDCSHYCEAAYTAVQAATMSRLAIQSAITKRGVGMVCIPGDTLAQPAAVDLPAHPFSTDPPRIRPTDGDLDKLAQIINSARRPLIFGGEGCRGARDQVLALSQKLNAPIGFSYRGKDVLEADNPNAVGMTGLLGWGGLQKGLDQCDVFIMLGTDFPYVDFIPKQPKIVQIDSDPTHLGRRAPLELGLCGHVADTLDALLPRIKSRGHDRVFLDEVLAGHATAMEHMKTYVEHGGSDGKTPSRTRGRCRQPPLLTRFDHYRGYRHVRRVGGAIPAAASRAKSNDFVQSRHDGQRHARLHRRANGISEPTGHRLLRRRRSLHAHGRSPDHRLRKSFPSRSLSSTTQPWEWFGWNRWSAVIPSGGPKCTTPISAPWQEPSASMRNASNERQTSPPRSSVPLHIRGQRCWTSPPIRTPCRLPPKATYEEARGFALAMTRMVMDHRSDQVFDLVKDNIRGMV